MILINNIYHMLAYAFQLLKSDGYASCGTEEFENTADLLSAILARGITAQIKRGLGKSYNDAQEQTSTPRGKIDISASISSGAIRQRRLDCCFDEFTCDTYLNRIVKTTALLLLRCDIPLERKKELRHLMRYFADVGVLEHHRINWKIRYNKNNQSYRMLIAICNLVITGLLQTTKDGEVKMLRFLDEQRMCRLYEKFILEYYRREHPEVSAASSQISWALDDEMELLLPTMQSDIMLTYDNRRTLIIDAKYYKEILQLHRGKKTVRSSHLYQIFTYVKNEDKTGSGKVSGLLLYARTTEETEPFLSVTMGGNLIEVRSLDLNQSFREISAALDSIAISQFGENLRRIA